MLTNLVNKMQPQIDLVGLDIGTASVKLIRLLKGKDGYTATAAVREAIQPLDKEDKPARAMAEAVKTCLKKANLSGANVVCGVSGPDVMVRGFKFPPLPVEAVDQAVRFEVQQVCPFDPKEMVLDYQLVENADGMKEQKTSKVMSRNGVMIACTENLVRSRKAVLTEAGAKPLLVDSDAMAMLNCLNELDLIDTTAAVAVIDVGWEYTNVVIYGQDGLPFARDLNNAGRHIIQKISAELQLAEPAVRDILTGGPAEQEVRNNILLALNKAVRPLAMAINETLRFYSFQEKTAGVENIFLCGGFALLDTFTEFLTDALPVEVQVLNPFERINCQAGGAGNELLKTEGPALVVAAGLAMRTI